MTKQSIITEQSVFLRTLYTRVVMGDFDYDSVFGTPTSKPAARRRTTQAITADLIVKLLADYYHNLVSETTLIRTHNITRTQWRSINAIHGPGFVEKYGKKERKYIETIDISDACASAGIKPLDQSETNIIVSTRRPAADAALLTPEPTPARTPVRTHSLFAKSPTMRVTPRQ